MKKNIIILCFFLSIINHGCNSRKEILSEELVQNIKARVDNGVNKGIVIGVVTPKGTSFYSYGVKSLATQDPINEHTVFEIGSITKTFTGLLFANEVVKGELCLDEPLQKLLPQGINAPTRNGEQIKLVHLANHTSGLPPVVDNYEPTHPENRYANLSIQQTYDFLNSCELHYNIGEKFIYSNLGMGLLGNVLASKNNTNFESLIIKEICEPLGMDDTKIKLTNDMKKRLAIGHRFGIEVDNWELPGIAGAGAIRSTANDMLKYVAANMGIVNKSLYPAMELSHKYTATIDSNTSIGLGWITTIVEGEEIIWHDGGTGGYMSFAGFSKGGEKGVVVLTNSNGFPDDIGFHILNPKSPLGNPKPSIANKLIRIITEEGIEAAEKAYANLKENDSDKFNFSESELNKLAYRFLGYGKIPEALAILKLNVEAHPESWYANNNYAEALLKGDKLDEAIEYFKKSIELNPENQNTVKELNKLGIEIKQ